MCSVDGVTGAVEALKCRESSSKWGANTCLSHVHDKLLKWYQMDQVALGYDIVG